MRERRITLPVLAILAATRGMIGFGAGLLTAERIARARRTTVGSVLLAVGVLSTIPLALRLFRRRPDEQKMQQVEQPALGPAAYGYAGAT